MGRRGFGQTPKLRSGRYQARYAYPTRATVHTAGVTFTTKSAAEGWLAKERRLIEDGTWTPPADRRTKEAATKAAEQAALVDHTPTVDAWMKKIIDQRATRTRRPLVATTVDLYRKDYRLCIKGVLGDLHLSQLTPEVIEDWWSGLPDHPTQNARAYSLLKSVLKDAVRQKVIASNPCELTTAGKPEPEHQGEALTVPEVLAYLQAVPERYRLALMLGAWCSLRSGEIRGLRRRDVDLDAKTITVAQAASRARTGKDGRYEWRIAGPKTAAGRRTVAMPDMMVEPMRTWIGKLPASDNRDALLFPASDHHSPIPSSVLWKAHTKGRDAIDRPELTVHDLRRTAATLAAQGGATTKEVMRLLGHTTVGVAMIYQVADDKRDRARADRLQVQIGDAIKADK